MEEAGAEEIFTDHPELRTGEANVIGATYDSLDLSNEKSREMMAIMQRNSDNIRRLNDILTSLTESILNNEEKFDHVQMQEDLKSLRLELKKSLEAQKDISKSNLNIEKDYSAIKAKLSKVYGREFFERRK